MKLKIKPLNDKAYQYYTNHKHFHNGDAGLDLYVLESVTIEPGETKRINLGISGKVPDSSRDVYKPS